nr:hypothetical protein [Pandoravirus massiliensis]
MSRCASWMAAHLRAPRLPRRVAADHVHHPCPANIVLFFLFGFFWSMMTLPRRGYSHFAPLVCCQTVTPPQDDRPKEEKMKPFQKADTTPQKRLQSFAWSARAHTSASSRCVAPHASLVFFGATGKTEG